MEKLPDLSLSHFELNVKDAARMEDFYSRVLGFVVTDRGEGPRGLVFLSHSPDEHHQVVLNPGTGSTGKGRRMDHLSFRVRSIAALRAFHVRLAAEPDVELTTVSHGTTWSVYLRDPEENRLELFTDTPWHVDQPCRFPVDLTLDDDALAAFTEKKIRAMPGFKRAEEWQKTHVSLLAGEQEKPGS